MANTITMRGGGGGAAEQSEFVQKPDTLRSNDSFEGLLGLCIGPIKGPVNGLKSIRINETPIEDASGNPNFENFTAVFADGDPLKFPQKVDLKLGAAGAPLAVNAQLRNIGGGAPVWLTRTVANLNADAIDLRFVVQALYKQTENGIFEAEMNLELEMKPSGTTTWINPFHYNGDGTTIPYDEDGYSGTSDDSEVEVYFTKATWEAQTSLIGYPGSPSGSHTTGEFLKIQGKTTSAYVKELRIRVPNTGAYANKSWDIRVRLKETESLDADPNFEKRTVNWESAAAVYYTPLGDHEDWRGVAWLQMYGKAGDVLNGVPDADGIYDTKIVQVPPPSVFNPETRAYTGTLWDGSFAKAYTNDPAWAINDVISDSLSGVARLVPGAHLNKWDALELSQHCSELVDDGDGGLHPRFSMNLVLSDPMRSDELVRYMAGACAATAWDSGQGEWRTVVDKARTPAALFTLENIEGEFGYAHTDIDARFNDVTVIFLNEEFDYREDRIRVEDAEHIALYGRKPTKVVAIGCTHRQQALRWAILKLRTCTNEFRMNTFSTNRQGKYLERFDWILVADGSLNTTVTDAKRSSGRIVENRGGSIVLRDTVRLETGFSYVLHVTIPNPDYAPDSATAPTTPDWNQPTIVISRAVVNNGAQRGDVRELFLDTPLPADVAENANVALETLYLPAAPRVYRIIDIKNGDDAEHVILSTIEVDTGKYLAADTANYDYIQPGYGEAATIPAPIAPVGGVFTLNTFNSKFNGTTRALVANWDRPDMGNFQAFEVRWRFNYGAWITLPQQTEDFWEFPGEPQEGRYDIEIRCVNTRRRRGRPITGTIVVPGIAKSVYVSFGPSVIQAEYDSTGATAQNLPRTELYKLSANALELNDATWKWRVVDGGVNGLNSLSGWQTMTASAGVGSITINSVEVADSKIEIQGTSAKKSASITATLPKVLLAYVPPATSGYVAKNSGWTSLATPSNSTYTVIGTLDLAVPAGKTTASAAISLYPKIGVNASNDGPWDVQVKLQRLVGGTWNDVGSIQASNPDPYLATVDSGGYGGEGGGGGPIP